ncbi:MAG TPA: DUF2336 domain-containing protein [Microvirga sp.]|jgi:uncharacterized protein (DUF2336 family)|nr:DUF2336 domain-containing protein [Microvirga sp.]
MIIRHFLLWARTAPADQRAEAVGALARAYLESDLTPAERLEAELALLAMADDPEPAVRAAMSCALCRSADAPRAVIQALLQDVGEVAAPLLAHSPLPSEAELIDLAAISAPEEQAAIARRATVSPALAGALCEVGAPEAVLALLRNPGATLASVSLARVAERLGHHVAIREELLRRSDLPIEVRLTLATRLARTLYDYADQKGQQAERMERAAREARERAVVSIAVGADPQLMHRMVAHLRKTGELTPALILRATLSHGLMFAETAFAELTGFPVSRVAAILKGGGAPLDALYRRAGLPRSIVPALTAALSALHEHRADESPAGLSRRIIDRAITASEVPGHAGVTALLQRYEAEALRDEARALARSVAEEAGVLDLSADELAPGRRRLSVA